MRRLALITTVALLGFAACSSDSSSDGPTDSTTAAPDSTDAPPATGADTTVAGGEASLPAEGAGSEFCNVNQELNEAQLLDGTATPAEIEEYFTTFFPDALNRLTDVTPPELENDVATLIDGVQEFGTVLEENGWDVNLAFADPQLTEILSSEEFTLAGERVNAYCGV